MVGGTNGSSMYWLVVVTPGGPLGLAAHPVWPFLTPRIAEGVAGQAKDAFAGPWVVIGARNEIEAAIRTTALLVGLVNKAKASA